MAEIYELTQSKGDQPPRIKVFGLGSAGCGMVEAIGLPRVAVSTSSADLERSTAERKVLVGQDRLVSIYSSDSDVLKQVPSVIGHELVDVFNNTDLAFLMCGLGGVSGSLGAKVLSSIAGLRGAMSVVFAATPFSVESGRRRDFANRMLREIRETSLCVEFGNDELSTLAPNLPMSRAFALMNGIMVRPVIDLGYAISRKDVPHLMRLLKGSDIGRFGLGIGRGDDRVDRAVAEAVGSPWFDFQIADSSCAIAVYSSADPWDKELERIAGSLSERLPDSSLVLGSYADQTLGDKIRLSLLLCRVLEDDRQ
jgi:cell division protein FtsZ